MNTTSPTTKVRCAICDKPLKGKGQMVRMNTAFEPIAENDPVEDMGWFEVGPDCYRKAKR